MIVSVGEWVPFAGGPGGAPEVSRRPARTVIGTLSQIHGSHFGSLLPIPPYQNGSLFGHPL